MKEILKKSSMMLIAILFEQNQKKNEDQEHNCLK